MPNLNPASELAALFKRRKYRLKSSNASRRRVPLSLARIRNETFDGSLPPMTTFYFDFIADGSPSIDEEGVELPDVEAAHDLAVGALADAASEAVLEGMAEQSFSIQVRNEIGPGRITRRR